MRLIDADALVEEMRKWYWDTEKQRVAEKDVSPMDLFTNLAITTVKNQPTAYDANNVVSDLEQLKLDGACNNEDCGYCKYFNECWDGDMSEEHAIDMAIEIVKRGGLDES